MGVEHDYMKKGETRKRIEDSFKSFMSNCFSKGPGITKVTIVDDMIIIYCEGLLTSLEQNLSKEENGELYVKILRNKMLKDKSAILIEMVEKETGFMIKDFYYDFNVNTNSFCSVFIMDI